MAAILFRVAEVYGFRPDITVIVTDCPVEAVPVPLKIGEVVEFQNPDGSVFKCPIAGIEMASPFDPKRPFAFKLPRGTNKACVHRGAEVRLAATA